MMIQYIKTYSCMFATFVLIDLVWIGLVARSYYKKHLGYILADKPVWPAAILFYLLFVLGVMVFVVIPGSEVGICRSSMLRAAFFGLVCYATFDLTCLALVKDWPVSVTVVDTLWGMLLSTAVSVAGLLTYKLL